MGTRIDEMRVEKGNGSRRSCQPRARINQKVKSAINVPPPPLDEVVLSGDRASIDFMKGISHELHTPLHVIIGLCQLLERDRTASLSPLQLDAVERMERNARALLKTANRLLGCLRSGQFE